MSRKEGDSPWIAMLLRRDWVFLSEWVVRAEMGSEGALVEGEDGGGESMSLSVS